MRRALFAVVLLTVLIAVPATAGAQSGTDPIPPDLAAQMDNLVQVTEILRGLDTLAPVERAFPTREETIAYLTEVFNTDLPPAEAARLGAFYQALGLLPKDVDVMQAYLTLLGSQVAGFYDPDTKIMNVIPMLGDSPGEGLSLTEQIIFVHEYVHALQDQHFGLDALDDPAVTDVPDRALALTALVEGDASAAMQLYTQEALARNPMAAISLLAEGALSGTLALPPGTPDVLARELLFPYEQGLNFVLALARNGNWEAVNAAYANPPTTSEQIIHPEKYVAGEGAVERPEWDAAHAAPGPDWSTLWDVPLGEYYLREHLLTLMAQPEASAAAAGWGGDRFSLFQNADGAWAWMLTTAWDSEADAAEFLSDYLAGLNETYGAPLADDSRCTAVTDGIACVAELTNGDTRVVVAPTLDEATGLLER